MIKEKTSGLVTITINGKFKDVLRIENFPKKEKKKKNYVEKLLKDYIPQNSGEVKAIIYT